MKLSIITINLNNKDGLKKTIDSVMSQTWCDFEWIIIDGGSTDGSKEVIEELAKNPLANISYWCSELDGGIYSALNKGVRYAHGEYVSFMNAGDNFHDAEVLQNVFKTNPVADILYGDTIIVFPEERKFTSYPSVLFLSWFYLGHTICHQSTFTKRSVFDKIIFDTKFLFLADRKFWMECLLNNYTFKYYNLTISDYDFTGCSSQNIDKWEDEQQKIFDDIISEGLREDIQNSIHFSKIPYQNEMEDISNYGQGTLRIYGLLNTLFFKIMRIRFFNGCFNAIYKLSHYQK